MVITQGKIKNKKNRDLTFKIVHTKLNKIFNKAWPEINSNLALLKTVNNFITFYSFLYIYI